MNYSISLPKDGTELASLVWRHCLREDSRLAWRRTMWLLSWYYLNGYRRFDIFNPATGQMSPNLMDEEGNLEFQLQDLLYAINQVAGRIGGMDFRPSCTTQGTSLRGLKDRALCQIVADSVVDNNHLSSVKSDFAYLFACLGSCGIIGQPQDHPVIGLTSTLRVVHPREILPFPSHGQDHTKNCGIVWQRVLPLDDLRREYGRKVIDNKDMMEVYEVDPGENWDKDTDEATSTYEFHGSRPHETARGTRTKRDTIMVARVRELWTFGPNRTVQQYALCSGNYTIERDDLSTFETYCPLGFARFFDNGTFHGAGMFDLLFSQHRELERLTKSLYNNIRDIDRYGVLVLPQGEMDKNNILRDIGHGLRVMFWQPDVVGEGFNPTSIQPFNSGDVPGRVAAFAKEQLASINPIRDLIEEKGRIDSAIGLQFLEDQVSQSLTSPTSGVQRAWGDCYRSLVQRSIESLVFSPRPIPVGNLTLDLAGAIIDPESNEVTFEDNPIPSPTRISFGIRSLSPRSTTARKQEAIQLWEQGIVSDPISFELFAHEEGLDFAMWKENDGAYEATIRNILTLYGNGSTPGRIVLTPHTIKPEIFLRVLSRFMVGPAMLVASPEVINQFGFVRQYLIQSMGMALPSMIPNPEDDAIFNPAPEQPQPGAPTGGAPQPQLR